MTQRTWIVLPVSVLCSALVACTPRGAGERARAQPNFLLIVTDDQRYDALGVVQREQGERGRFPWLRTPAMDRLATEGVRFRQSFAVNALCSPSRASILTGRYPHEVGVLDNHTPFPADTQTFAQTLRASGYRTAYVGKWHMGRQGGTRPGFEHSASYLGHGQYFDCPFEVDGVTTPTSGWVDDVAAQFAARYVRAHRSEPFLVMVGLKSGHSPFQPPDRWRGELGAERPRSVPNLDVPAVYSANRPKRPTPRRRDESAADGAAPQGPDEFAQSYLETLCAADDALGQLLDLLDELDLARDTLVLFTSDNGLYLGEHGLRDKRTAYEESIRTPLVVRYPRRAPGGMVLDALALNVDIAPTLLDYAGVAALPGSRGRSLRSLLESRQTANHATQPWRDAFLYGYVAERGSTAPSVTALRTERHKLVVYPGRAEWTELFDLASDPYETRNLAGEASLAELLTRLERERVRWMAELDFPTRDPARAPNDPEAPDEL